MIGIEEEDHSESPESESEEEYDSFVEDLQIPGFEDKTPSKNTKNSEESKKNEEENKKETKETTEFKEQNEPELYPKNLIQRNENKENNSKDSEEIFEINDFSISSPFEKLVADLELLISDLLKESQKKKQKTELQSNEKQREDLEPYEFWKKDVFYKGICYTLKYIKNNTSDSKAHLETLQESKNQEEEQKKDKFCKENMDSMEDVIRSIRDTRSDFAHHNSQHLYTWFGIPKYLILYNEEDKNRIDKSLSLVFLSALTLSLNHISTSLPFFVGSFEEGVYIGRSFSHPSSSSSEVSLKTLKFQTEKIRIVPPLLTLLSGLSDLFHLNISKYQQQQYHLSSKQEEITKILNPKVSISARFSYELEQHDFSWYKTLRKYYPLPKKEVMETNDNDRKDQFFFPWGTYHDPVETLIVSCKWKNFLESEMENQKSSKLIPEVNQDKCSWTILCLKEPFSTENSKISKIGKKLQFFLKQVRNQIETPNSLNFDPEIEFDSEDFSNFKEALSFVFNEEENGKEEENVVSKDIKGKGVPMGSLISLIALKMIEFDQIKELRYFWTSCINKLKWLWKEKMMVPHTNKSKKPQDVKGKFNLIYQKLMMLNCCVDKLTVNNILEKVNGEEIDIEIESDGESNDDEGIDAFDDPNEEITENFEDEGFGNDDDDNDEFDDAFEDANEEEEDKTKDLMIVNNKKREGTLKILKISNDKEDGNDDEVIMKMEKNGKPIFIPITRSPLPYTEDMLVSEQLKLIELGTSKEGTLERAKKQSGSLISDMEAFKAANPESQFIDFIKWYSPNDYNITKNSLSTRMLEHSYWIKLWETTKPCSVENQNPGLNYFEEGEKVIEWFDSFSFSKLIFIVCSHIHQIMYRSLIFPSNNTKSSKIIQKIIDLKLIDLSILQIYIYKFSKFGNLDSLNSGESSEDLERKIKKVINLNNKIILEFARIENTLSLCLSIIEKLKIEDPEDVEKIQKCLETAILENGTPYIVPGKNYEEQKILVKPLHSSIEGKINWRTPNTRQFIFREENGHRMYICFRIKELFRVASCFVDEL